MGDSTPSSRPSTSCLDCPMRRRGTLRSLVGTAGEGGCKLACLSIESREPVPASVFTQHAFGIVRRGLLVRQRGEDPSTAVAVDVAGPGAYVPLANARFSSGYAVSRVLLCVHPEPRFDGVDEHPEVMVELSQLIQDTLDRVESIAEARGRASAAARVEALDALLSRSLSTHGLDALLQRDIAAVLGLRPETVCRAMRARAHAPIPGAAETLER